MAVEIRRSPTDSIANIFSQYLPELTRLLNQTPIDEVAAQNLLNGIILSVQDQTPKVVGQAVLENLHFPAQWQTFMKTDASARLYAFSPRYNPDAIGAGPLKEAERNGGLVMQASLSLGNVLEIENAELSVLPREGLPPALNGQFEMSQFTPWPGVNLGASR